MWGADAQLLQRLATAAQRHGIVPLKRDAPANRWQQLPSLPSRPGGWNGTNSPAVGGKPHPPPWRVKAQPLVASSPGFYVETLQWCPLQCMQQVGEVPADLLHLCCAGPAAAFLCWLAAAEARMAHHGSHTLQAPPLHCTPGHKERTAQPFRPADRDILPQSWVGVKDRVQLPAGGSCVGRIAAACQAQDAANQVVGQVLRGGRMDTLSLRSRRWCKLMGKQRRGGGWSHLKARRCAAAGAAVAAAARCQAGRPWRRAHASRSPHRREKKASEDGRARGQDAPGSQESCSSLRARVCQQRHNWDQPAGRASPCLPAHADRCRCPALKPRRQACPRTQPVPCSAAGLFSMMPHLCNY